MSGAPVSRVVNSGSNVNAEQFRRLALRLPETSEESHMGHPDFRVRGKIFATLGYPKKGWAMVKLSPEQQHLFLLADPEVFIAVKGAWGRRGSTNVLLKSATKRKLEAALDAAWRNVAPKALIKQQDK